jgi:hypothetical protein
MDNRAKPSFTVKEEGGVPGIIYKKHFLRAAVPDNF